MVIGTPGSGKSYAIVNSYIRQLIAKGFAIYIYDYKFDDLSTIAYNSLLKNMDKYEVKPRFYVINFDDPHRSHRCNPINPEFMTDISDAYEASYTIMLNLNRTWIEKQGDFFVESPIILLAAIIWYLKIYKNGIYCTFPHAVELLNKPYSDLFTILTSYPELENYLSPFMDAWKGNAQDQLQGQIASAKIPLTRMISPQLYWVMTGNDFHWISTIRKSPNCSAWATIRTGRTFIRQRSDYIIPVSSSLSTRKNSLNAPLSLTSFPPSISVGLTT